MNMQMDGTFVGSVVLSGMSIVFLALVLLIIFVLILDVVFKAVNGAKKKKAAPAPKEEIKAAPALKAAPAPVVEDGISDEVVAVIAAAVAAMSAETGKTFRLTGIKRSGGTRRGAWGNAGAAENTRPF